MPADLVHEARHGRWRGQQQKWFVMRFTGNDSDIDLVTEHPEFSAWKWVPIERLPDLIVSFKRQVYLDLLAEFGELSRLATLLGEPIVRLTMAADNVNEGELYDLLRRVSENLRRRPVSDTGGEEPSGC